jgi:hypothetical protein
MGPPSILLPHLTPRSFPTHGPCGNCPTTPCIFHHARELRCRGRAPESMHDPSGLQSTQVLLFWHRDGSGSMTSHVKRDRSCHRACAILFGHTQATGGSVGGARPGATVGALGLGSPSTDRLACATRRKDKDPPSGGQAEAQPACRPPLPRSKEPSASPLAGRRQR